MLSHMAPASEVPALPSLPDAHVAAIFVANHQQFLGFLEKRVGERAVAEDILQDAFVRGIQKLDTLHSDESAVAWFYRLLRNAVIDHRRRRGANERKLAAFGAEVERSVDAGSELRGAICRCVVELATTLDSKYAHALHSAPP